MNTTIESGLENIARAFNPSGKVLITEGLRLKGDLGFSSPGRMEGYLEGSIFSEHPVVIGEQSVVKGGVSADRCEILGKVEGQIVIREELFVPANADVRGTVKAGSIKIEPGAKFVATLNVGGLSPLTPSTWGKIKGWVEQVFKKKSK